jgi:hypothetical protein
MKWTKASLELPPEHEEVLIRCNGMTFLGYYSGKSGHFVDRLGAGIFAPLNQIYWARLDTPAR